MENRERGSKRHWYAIYTHLKQENRAIKNLNLYGDVDVLYPQYKERYCNQFTGKPSYSAKSLFPRYIFARFDLERLYQKVIFTRGVSCVLCSNGRPTPVDDQVIDLLCKRLNEDGFIETDETLKPGDKVKIEAGPFKDFIGVFERGRSGDDRISILLQTIEYTAHALISRELVTKIN
jgi:transcriptional antiterminator RfaH